MTEMLPLRVRVPVEKNLLEDPEALYKSLSFDFVIVGGGIQGLSVARSLLEAFPKCSICVMESARETGGNASSLNSGVLHAGIYYSPGSKKARMAIQGNASMAEFLNSEEVPFERCGKLIVPGDESEMSLLENLLKNGLANGAKLEMIESEHVAKLNPLASYKLGAIWSPNTGVADPKATLAAMEKRLSIQGVEIRYGVRAKSIEGSDIHTVDGQKYTGQLGVVNAAGPGALRLAKQAGLASNLAVTLFQGRYRLAKIESPTHIYPVPNPDLPFLGIHASRTLSGYTKIGPTATPRLDFSPVYKRDSGSLGELGNSIRGFVRHGLHSPLTASKTLFNEIGATFSSQMLRELNRIAPGIESFASKKMIQGPTRAQLVNLGTGKLVDDFLTIKTESTVHLLNSVSPGWTTAIETGNEIASLFEENS